MLYLLVNLPSMMTVGRWPPMLTYRMKPRRSGPPQLYVCQLTPIRPYRWRRVLFLYDICLFVPVPKMPSFEWLFQKRPSGLLHHFAVPVSRLFLLGTSFRLCLFIRWRFRYCLKFCIHLILYINTSIYAYILYVCMYTLQPLFILAAIFIWHPTAKP